ncbi:unnamed protein product [Cuscuta europaea]|uniref:Uncharacterized protein n=1 Tax=Cuscuta europaea TaxID=41803 RepID=A0A9P0ZXU7_CUSEU|nr:unnamed protein product [Cuscuta europaea]
MKGRARNLPMDEIGNKKMEDADEQVVIPVVGAVITDRKINLPVFQVLMSSVWRSGKPLWCNNNDEEDAVKSKENRFGATTTAARARPPPEPPPRVDRCILEFAYLSFLHFNFQVKTFVFCCYFNLCCKTLELRTGDGEFSLLVIGSSKPNSGSTNLVALFEVADSKSGSRADGRLWVLCLIVSCLSSFLLI